MNHFGSALAACGGREAAAAAALRAESRGDILTLRTIRLDKPLTAVVEWYQSCLNPKTVAAIV